MKRIPETSHQPLGGVIFTFPLLWNSGVVYYVGRSSFDTIRLLGALVMEFHTDNRIFVNTITKRDRKNIRMRTLKWYLGICFSELCGTAFLLFVSCLGSLPSFPEISDQMRGSVIAGGTVFIIVQILGHISGSHINPTITISAMICRLVSIQTGLLYIAAQFVGALLGYGALLATVPNVWLFPKNSSMEAGHQFCVTVPNPKLNTTQAFIFEFIADFLLVTICWGLWDKRSQSTPDLTGIKLGVAVFGIVLTFGNFTGPSLNTARSFAPAIFTGVWTSHWIYWVAPITAAVAGSFSYKVLFHNFRNLDEPEEATR